MQIKRNTMRRRFKLYNVEKGRDVASKLRVHTSQRSTEDKGSGNEEESQGTELRVRGAL